MVRRLFFILWGLRSVKSSTSKSGEPHGPTPFARTSARRTVAPCHPRSATPAHKGCCRGGHRVLLPVALHEGTGAEWCHLLRRGVLDGLHRLQDDPRRVHSAEEEKERRPLIFLVRSQAPPFGGAYGLYTVKGPA